MDYKLKGADKLMSKNNGAALSDARLEKVFKYLSEMENLKEKVGRAMREAIDLVLAGRYTKRYSINQLDKTEKTYIGTAVQFGIQKWLQLESGQKLDTVICDEDVDIKFSISGKWMIPTEAIDEICLIGSISEKYGTFDLGLIRTSEAVLGPGKNKDKKRGISRSGKKEIRWLIKRGKLPENALMKMDSNVIAKIFSHKTSGQERINELFRLNPGKIIDGITVETVAAEKDSAKRVRDARLPRNLGGEGFKIYSNQNNATLKNLGLTELKPGEFIAVKQ